MSLMSSLYTGNSSLRVSQNAINTTAHNLANVDTKGFTRQQVIITDHSYKTIGSNAVGLSQVGTGAAIASIMTYRNMFLDQSYRENSGRLGFYNAQYEAISEVENLLGETEGVAFQSSVSQLWSNIQELSKDPGNIVVRSNFVNSCVSFLERSKNIANQLNEYQKSLNTSIVEQVDQINEIGKKIVALNQSICGTEAAGIERANDDRNRRDVLLDELSQLVGITYKEDHTGAVSISIEGNQFVSETHCFEMGITKVDEQSELLKPVWPHLGGVDVFPNQGEVKPSQQQEVGYLKGLIVARGDKEAIYTDCPQKPQKTEGMSDDEYQIAMDQYEKAVKKFNQTVDASSIMTTQAQFDQLIHAIVTKINDVLCPNTTVTDETTGISYIVLDKEKAPIGMDDEASSGIELFVRANCSRYEEKEINGQVYRVYQSEDTTKRNTLYTLQQISVNQEILSNYSKLPLTSNNGSGAFDHEVCQKLLKEWQTPFGTLSPNTLTSFDINSYYTNMIGEIANRGGKYVTLVESQQLTLDAVEGQRQSISGVSSDEELTNLIRFQHAYGASSRYITTVNDLLEALLNM